MLASAKLLSAGLATISISGAGLIIIMPKIYNMH